MQVSQHALSYADGIAFIISFCKIGGATTKAACCKVLLAVMFSGSGVTVLGQKNLVGYEQTNLVI